MSAITRSLSGFVDVGSVMLCRSSDGGLALADIAIVVSASVMKLVIHRERRSYRSPSVVLQHLSQVSLGQEAPIAMKKVAARASNDRPSLGACLMVHIKPDVDQPTAYPKPLPPSMIRSVLSILIIPLSPRHFVYQNRIHITQQRTPDHVGAVHL